MTVLANFFFLVWVGTRRATAQAVRQDAGNFVVIRWDTHHPLKTPATPTAGNNERRERRVIDSFSSTPFLPPPRPG